MPPPNRPEIACGLPTSLHAPNCTFYSTCDQRNICSWLWRYRCHNCEVGCLTPGVGTCTPDLFIYLFGAEEPLVSRHNTCIYFVIGWDPNTNNQILAYIRVWALSFAYQEEKGRGWAHLMGARRRWSARGRPGHLAQSGGRARPVVAVSNKGGGRRKGGSAGPVLAVMPALMRHSEVRGEAGGANSREKSSRAMGRMKMDSSRQQLLLLLTGKAVRCVGSNPSFWFWFWGKIQNSPREFTTLFSIRFARTVPEYTRELSLAADGD